MDWITEGIAMGISRSVSFVVASLVADGLELEEALQLVMERRRVALPHPVLLRSICECYDLGHNHAEIVKCVARARKAAREGRTTTNDSEEGEERWDRRKR